METTMLRPGSPQGLMQIVRRLMLEINTSIPGEVIAFNPTLQTAIVKPCIKGTTIGNNGTVQYYELPQIIEVPVYFPFSTGSKFSVTYSIHPGDQCLIVFSQRSFDNWLAMGSVQNPSEPGEPRAHQYPDALALVGFAPNPMAIQDFQLEGNAGCLYDGIEIRNGDRNSYVKIMDKEIRIHEGKADIDIHTDGTMELSIQATPFEKDGLQTMTGVTYLKISPDGTTTLLTPAVLNVTSAVVTVAAATSVTVTSPISTINGDVVINGNLTVSSNTLINGNLVVDNNTLSDTYSVGSGNNIKAGITGASDYPSYQAGLVIG